jgi:hypothetical protein
MNKETKSPKKEWSDYVGVSEADFHAARSNNLRQHRVSTLERMTLIRNGDNTPSPIANGNTPVPTE